jgi:putative membrane protein insertion efficiency factor
MKKRALAVIAILVIAVALDLRRPPSSQWTTAAAIGGIHVYQATISPIYARMGFRCRFTVSCSHYGEEAVKKYGLAKGGYLTAKRILRCGPWTPMGTVDPVP